MDRTPNDLLVALQTIIYAEQDQIYKYFEITRNTNNFSCLDCLMSVVLGCTADEIFDGVEKYKIDKQERDDSRDRLRVKDLADWIGLDKLCEFAEQLKGERDERAARKVD